MTTLDVLVKAREMIDVPEKWLKGAGREGCRRCLYNAVCEASRNINTLALAEICAVLPGQFAGGNICDFNDDPLTTHADVLRVLDAAIARARE